MSPSYILCPFPLVKISEGNRNDQEKVLPWVCLRAFPFEKLLVSIPKLRGWHGGKGGGLSRGRECQGQRN